MRRLAALSVALALAAPAFAQEAAIRKNLAERLPNFPKIDEVVKSPIPGLYEVRSGNEIFYTDEQGNYIVDGQLIDTRTRANLTQERIDKLTAIDFAKLPFKDAKEKVIGAFERAYLSALLSWADGNVSCAARKANLDRMYLHRLLQRHGLRKSGTLEE